MTINTGQLAYSVVPTRQNVWEYPAAVSYSIIAAPTKFRLQKSVVAR